MKSYIIGLMTALLLTLAGNTEAAPKRIKGSGQIASKAVQVEQFEAITASRGIDVKLINRENKRLIIYADDNLLEYVVAKVTNGTLHLTIDDQIRTVSNIHITIEVPTDGRLRLLRTMAAAEIESEVNIVAKRVVFDTSSGGEISANVVAEEFKAEATSSGEIEGNVKCNACKLDASSSGEIELTLTTQTCSIDASSAAEIELEGAALQCTVNVSSAAEVDCSKFAVKEGNVEASSGAEASIYCIDKFNGRASSAGSITVYGKAEHFSRSVSSAGRIHRK